MKVKRYATSQKTRIRRNADAEVPSARRLKELGKRNRGLRKMLAGSLLKMRILKIVNTKRQ